MASKRNVTYNCPFCSKRFNRRDLVVHISDSHEDELPEDFTPLRYVFNYVNKKPLSYHGKCTECGKSTPWDENKGRYDRQCGSKACHDSYVKKFEDNMMKTRGTTRISSTAEGQKKMLANRKISGTYRWSDGTEKTYTGSYELKALEFMDKVMNIKSDDILCPGPILEYSFEGKTHIYITDFYYQPYNLIIEVKDGGDNPNKRNMPEYRAKQIAKEQFIIKHTNYNYLRLTNNNLKQLILVFTDLKYQLIENTGERVIHVNESVNPIVEYMNALMSGKVVGLRDADCCILKPNNLSNNVFAGIADGKFDKLIKISDNGVLELADIDESQEYTVYKLPVDKYKLSNIVKEYFNTPITESQLYEIIFNHPMYSKSQIKYDAEPIGIYKEGMFTDFNIENEFFDYLGLKDDIDFNSIDESMKEVFK